MRHNLPIRIQLADLAHPPFLGSVREPAEEVVLTTREIMAFCP